MSVTPSTFKVRFPEFASEADARIQIFLDDAVVILNETYWGTKYDLGVAYHAAHALFMANQTASGGSGVFGPVSNRTVDGTSVSYAVPQQGSNDTDSDAYYNLTSYGQKYLSFRKTLGVPAHVI
jgi:hypothetical protein